MRKSFLFVFAVFLILASGCQQTYHEDKLAQELAYICKNEYGIENIQVKVSGQTLGVFLPLKKLFNANFKEALMAQKIQNIESMLQPSQEALDQVEDVLFSTSRVILSTKRDIRFYALQATDVESTGLQLVLTGYVDDIKRVRLWDIPRSEYRKRVLHDLKLNRTVIWSKPILSIFESLGTKSPEQILQENFNVPATEEVVSPVLMDVLREATHKKNIVHEFVDMRSQSAEVGEVLIYAKVKEMYEVKPGEQHQFLYPSGTILDYIFAVKGLPPDQLSVIKVIPLFYFDEAKVLKPLAIPTDLRFEENLNEWQPIFEVEDTQLGDFLAKQLTRRIEGMLASDERIYNTFTRARALAQFIRPSEKTGKKPYFSIDLDIEPRSYSFQDMVSGWFDHEDAYYLLNLIVRDFMSVLRSYRFDDYDHIAINNIAIPASGAILPKANLELFRRGKIDINALFHPRPAVTTF